MDDATSSLLQLYFCDGERLQPLRGDEYVGSHGKPVVFDSDKAPVFRSNRPEPQGGDGVTQFGRALNDLNIDIICANSAPAKGRVERANSTLQDRLVKELRLRGISSVDAANAFALEFVLTTIRASPRPRTIRSMRTEPCCPRRCSARSSPGKKRES